MKLLNSLLLGSGLLGVIACGDSSSDPASQDRNSFNPPGTVVTATGDGEVTLYITTANVESDFKGYYILGVNKSLDDLSLATNVKYPEGADLTIAGIPRCGKNSPLFETFGFVATDNDCDTSLLGSDTDETAGAGLAEDDAEEAKEIPPAFLLCEGTDEAATLSLPIASGKSVGVQKCTVKKVYDAEKKEKVAITNGTPMSFMVVAVSGDLDDLDEISWTSNIVEDAGSTTALNPTDNPLKLEAANYKKITVAFADEATAKLDEAATPCSNATTNNVCRVFNSNGASSSEYEVFVARDWDKTGKFPERVFVSTPAGSLTAIRPRGPETSHADFADFKNFAPRIPGDEPLISTAYDETGTTYIVTGNQVFDLRFETDTNSGKFRYGKLVVDTIALADDEANGEATISAYVILQPGEGVQHYAW